MIQTTQRGVIQPALLIQTLEESRQLVNPSSIDQELLKKCCWAGVFVYPQLGWRESRQHMKRRVSSFSRIKAYRGSSPCTNLRLLINVFNV
jgi:hypothetical protein